MKTRRLILGIFYMYSLSNLAKAMFADGAGWWTLICVPGFLTGLYWFFLAVIEQSKPKP